MTKEIYWKDDAPLGGKGGVFYRCEIGQFIEKCRKEGMNIIGIVIDKEDILNVELIMEDEEFVGKGTEDAE
jgi:hypothetical protein